MMFLVMAAPVVLAAPPSASESSDEVSTEDKGEEDISGKAQGMLKSLLSSFQDLTAAQASVKVSGIPSTTETGGSGSAATKAKVDSEGAPTARILGSALYPPSGGVPDNLPLVSQTHWPTTGYHKNQYSSYYPHDPTYWYRLAASGYASPYHYSPYYYEEDEYEGEDDYCPPCNCDEEKEDEDEGHYDKDDSVYYDEDEDEEYEEEYEVVHKNPYDHETDYGYDEDFYAILRSVQEEKETENAKKSRSKRSAPQPFDWHSVGGPSKFLEKHNVGYRIKNDLRKRLEEEKFPRYVGFLNTKPKHSKKHSKKPHKNHSKHHGLKKHRGPKKHHKKHSTHKKHGGHKRHHKKHGTHKKHHGFKKPHKKHSHKKQNPPPLPPPFPFPIMPGPMPVPPVPEEPMPNPGEEEESGMPPMMPGDEGSGMPPMPPPMMPGDEVPGMPPMMPGEEESGMPPMMPGQEESGMPPMMPGEEESGMMPPMMSGDDMGMMPPMPTPPPVDPMDANVLNQWIGICKEFCTCQVQGAPVFPCSCEPSNPNFDACGNLLNALQLVCINDVPNTIPCPLEF